LGKRITQRKIRRLSITFSDGKSEYSGTSSNFSTTGLFIRTRKALSPGTPIEMVAELDNNRRINLTGIVVRSIKTGIADFKNGMGIKLTSIPQEYQDFINELLHSL
jgi:Tfp pilus assembly protein PilZ